MKTILFENEFNSISISNYPQSKEEISFWTENYSNNDKLILICNEFLTTKKLKEFKKLNYYKNCIFLCNSKIEKKLCDNEQLLSCFINKICLLNENLFVIDETIKKEYIGIYSTSFSNRKRLNICKNIKEISVIFNYKNELPDFFKTLNIINDKTIEKENLYKYYNKANFGVSLITQDNSSYTIGEYLLCGLPILTVPSIGGKNIWLNKYNSILVDPTEESIKLGINACIENIEKGIFNSELIRRKQIILVNEHRTKLIKFLSTLTSLSFESCKIILDEIINNYHLLR